MAASRGPDVNLNEVAGPAWIDDTGRRARDRLRAGASEAVIGHCDWLAANLRWNADKLLVVHDWDSVTADSEAVLAGFAAALYSTVSVKELATVEETQRFLVAYCDAHGRELSADELERSWAAGSGRGPTMPSISTQSGNPSSHSPRMRLVSASAVLGSANAGAIMASFGTQLKPVSLNVLAMDERPRRTSPPNGRWRLLGRAVGGTSRSGCSAVRLLDALGVRRLGPRR